MIHTDGTKTVANHPGTSTSRLRHAIRELERLRTLTQQDAAHYKKSGDVVKTIEAEAKLAAYRVALDVIHRAA